ncbi:unnamed protein product [Trichobilharzia szidati]|nr:unnamed protein product [Trichobilharzia szidati]
MAGQLARRRPIVNHPSLSSRSMNDNNAHILPYRSGSRLNNKNLKRRTLPTNINSSSRKTASYPTIDDSSTAHGALDTSFTGASNENESRSQDSRVLGSQSSRDSTPSGGTTSTTTGGGSSCNVPQPSGASSANNYANNSIVLVLHSQGSNASGNSASLKLHIPRVSYNKDVTNARVHRLRRMNNINVGSGSDAAAAAMALAAGAQLFQQQQQQQFNSSGLYHEHNQQLANAVAAATQTFSPWNSFMSNPAVLARYGQGNASPGRHLPSALQNLMQMSNTSQFPVMKYSTGGNGGIVAGAANFPLTNTSPSLVGINVNGQLNTPINNAGPNTTAPINNNSTQLANQLYVGKQLDWLIYEEAALYLCITKLLDLNFEMNNSTNSSGTSMPNYRFAEFFLNNYLPNRCYRGARQCLLTHYKMQNIIASANTAGVSTASSGGGGSPLNSPFGLKPEDMSHPTTANAASGIPHGPSSRKVKNKMKSAAVAAAAAAAVAGMSMSSGSGGGPGCSGVVSGCGGNAAGANSAAAAAAALNRYRGYLFYQHLQTWFNMLPQNTSEGNTQTDSNPSVPPYLSPVIHAMIYNEDIQTSCLHKAIRDKLCAPSVQIHSTFRSSGSRRTGVSGNTGGNITGVAASSNLGYHSSGSGPSAGHYAHHSASTAPALLTHHRHRQHSTYDHSQGQNPSISTTEAGGVIGSVSSLNSNSGSGTTVVHSGPIIQKNPTHIAALQEHNINPDTLITPAMVIKNKEEREARQRAEAAAAAAALSASSQADASATSTSPQISTSSASADSGASQSDVITSDPSNSQHTEGVGVQSHSSHPSSDHVLKTSTSYTSASSELTASYNLSANSSPVSLPTTSLSSGGRASAQLSFAHNLSQRANSVMLPIRSSFNSNTGSSSGTVLSFTGQQSQQRLISVQNTSSSPSSGHYQFQPRQTLLHSSVGRLTHLTPGGSISNTQHVSPSNSHHVISSSAGGSSSPDDNAPRNIDLTSSNILIPGNWRTASNSRSLNVQTIVSSTPTVLRRSSTFTGISLAGQSNSGLQTCRLNPATSSVSQSLSTTSFTGTYMNTQIAKIPNSPSSSTQSNFYVQQRPQFLSTAQTSVSSPTRGVFTQPSNVAVIPSVSSNYSTSVTHLPQILRPRNTIRGSVVQPAFVRTIPASSGSASGVSGGSVVPVSTTQLGTRLSPSVGVSASNILHGRVTTLTVSSNNPSVANILSSRTGTQHSLSPTVFQSLRTCISGGVNNPPGNEQPHQSSSYGSGGGGGGGGGSGGNSSSSKS